MLAFPRLRSGAGDEAVGAGVVAKPSLDAASLFRTLTASCAAFSALLGLRFLSVPEGVGVLADLLKIFFSAVSSFGSPRPGLDAVLACGLSLLAFFSRRASIK